MASSILPTTVPGVTSATGTQSTAAANGQTSTKTDNQTVAANFQQFLTLLTTQLKNQNPLDPMDTNQFTQQLVQFAQVEHIRRFTVLPAPFSVETGELTPSLKIERASCRERV